MTSNGDNRSKGPLVLSILIITLGVGWLLTVQGIGHGIDWVWTLGLGVVGVLTFVLCGGVDKLSIVAGPFLLIGSVLSILRQTGRLNTDIEVPIMVILTGSLLLIAQSSIVPPPKWFAPLSADDPAKTSDDADASKPARAKPNGPKDGPVS